MFKTVELTLQMFKELSNGQETRLKEITVGQAELIHEMSSETRASLDHLKSDLERLSQSTTSSFLKHQESLANLGAITAKVPDILSQLTHHSDLI